MPLSPPLLQKPKTLEPARTSLLGLVLIGGLRAYKLAISPLLGSRCRFHPSCSVYAQESIRRFGVLKGVWLAARRLVRCGPWHPGGLDEVPPASDTLRAKAALDQAAGNNRNSDYPHSNACGSCDQQDLPLGAAENRNRA